MEIGISRITLISAKSHTWSQVDLYHVLYLPEINDWPLHSGKTVSVSAKMQFHAWVTNSGSPLHTVPILLKKIQIEELVSSFEEKVIYVHPIK